MKSVSALAGTNAPGPGLDTAIAGEAEVPATKKATLGRFLLYLLIQN